MMYQYNTMNFLVITLFSLYIILCFYARKQNLRTSMGPVLIRARLAVYWGLSPTCTSRNWQISLPSSLHRCLQAFCFITSKIGAMTHYISAWEEYECGWYSSESLSLFVDQSVTIRLKDKTAMQTSSLHPQKLDRTVTSLFLLSC